MLGAILLMLPFYACAFTAPSARHHSIGATRMRMPRPLFSLEPSRVHDKPLVDVAIDTKIPPSHVFFACTALVQICLLTPEMACASTTAPWVAPVRFFLDPALNFGQFFMLLRVLFSWYPEINVLKMPYLLVTFPTEPLLRGMRGVVPPAFGVDISPVVWIAIFSFFREIFFGQQGLFDML
mmetsp:Transcript_16339/g.32560  ORF Transcript_16339/g.32560 Transcript_16339/m.32560 type:complete len:181 (-) Transcript_16339:187-729(-)